MLDEPVPDVDDRSVDVLERVVSVVVVVVELGLLLRLEPVEPDVVPMLEVPLLDVLGLVEVEELGLIVLEELGLVVLVSVLVPEVPVVPDDVVPEDVPEVVPLP